MPPPGQHRRTTRARQPARGESLLDARRVRSYRDHRASERNRTVLPHNPATASAGGPSPTRRPRSSAPCRRRRTRSTRRADPHPHRHAQRRRPGATSSSSVAPNTLVSDDVFEQVQARIRSRGTSSNRTSIARVRRPHPLRGMVICEGCGPEDAGRMEPRPAAHRARCREARAGRLRPEAGPAPRRAGSRRGPGDGRGAEQRGAAPARGDPAPPGANAGTFTPPAAQRDEIAAVVAAFGGLLAVLRAADPRPRRRRSVASSACRWRTATRTGLRPYKYAHGYPCV